MARYSFEATEPDGSPRKFIGMHRPQPPFGVGYVKCSCGSILSVVPAVHSHWQMGHFDQPLYEESDSPPSNETGDA